MIETTEQPVVPKKKKSSPRAERKNPDYLYTVFNYPCLPLEIDAAGNVVMQRVFEPAAKGEVELPKKAQMPEQLWACARGMQELWNRLVEAFEKVREQDVPDLPKEQRKELYKAIDLEPLRDIARATCKGTLPSDCYYWVVDRFKVTLALWRKNPKVNGAPRRQMGLRNINIPVMFYTGKKTEYLTEWGSQSVVAARYVPPRERFPLKLADPNQYYNNGYFDVRYMDERFRVPLHVAFHRVMPVDGIIKRIHLVGKMERPFGYQWSLQVVVEHPPLVQSTPANRVAGLDLGWRVRDDEEDGLRIGVLRTSEGQTYELRLPFRFGNKRDLDQLAWLESVKGENGLLLTDWREIWAWQAKEDGLKDEMKAKLKGLNPEALESWPADARLMLNGLTKMGSGGLFRLRRVLTEAGLTGEIMDALNRWAEDAHKMRRWINGAQLKALDRRRDYYRNIAAWLARNFDVIAWEGDLNLKELAEDDTRSGADAYALANSMKYRMIASLSEFRIYVMQAMTKQRRDVLPIQAAFSTQVCNVKAGDGSLCGAFVEPSSKVTSICERGHQTDQDVRAADNFLSLAPPPVDMSTTELLIPERMQRLIRRID